MDSFVNGINAAYKKGIENPVFKKAIDEIAKGPVNETEKVAVVNKKQLKPIIVIIKIII